MRILFERILRKMFLTIVNILGIVSVFCFFIHHS
jgi:hypothetical protein